MTREPDAVALLMDQFPDGHPAADELIGLRSACHKLKAERNELRDEIERLRLACDCHPESICSDNKRLRADVERLRAVVKSYEDERLSRLGGIGSPA